MIMKNQLLNLKMIALMCLMMVLGGANVWAESKTYSYVFKSGDFSASKLSAKLNEVTWTLKVNTWNGNQGYGFDTQNGKGFKIGSNKKNYPKDATLSTSEIDGTITSIVINTSGNSKTTAKLDVLVGGKAFDKQQALSGDAKDLSFTGSASGQIELKYSNSNTPIYVKSISVTYEIAPAKTLTSLAISGEPEKKTYEVGEALDPTGLVVTGTYDDKSTATITNGITWTIDPATLSLNDVSCSVTATVDGVTSPAYNVTGLTVNKAKSSAEIKLTGNATTLGTDDEPNTFTVDYNGDGTLSATASAEGVVDLALVGKTVTVTPKAVGSVDITVAATEGTEYKAASTTYTVNVVPVGIAAIRNSITSKRDKEAFTTVKLKDAVVTYSGKTSATADKNTIYVEDKTAGVVFYVDGLNYEAGDVLNGTISGEGFVFQGLTEVTSIDASSNIVVTKNGVIPCQEVTVDELNKNMDKWESRRVKLLDVTVSSAMDSRNAKISQDGNTIAVYEKIRNCSGDLLSKVNTKIASIVCYPQDYNTTNQLCVWEKSDIVVATAEPTYTSATVNFVAHAGADYYATFSNANVVFMPSNVTISAVTVDNNDVVMRKSTEGVLGTEETVHIAGADVAGYYIPANTGVLLNSQKGGEVTYYTVENKTVDALAEGTNMLMPSVAGGVFDATADYKYYKLAYNDYTAKTGLGFYWGAENGGAFKVKAGTAYLAVPAGDDPAKGFAFNGEATGIEGVNANVENVKAIYNLNGQRVASMAKPGLYIVNGKKVVRK